MSVEDKLRILNLVNTQLGGKGPFSLWPSEYEGVRKAIIEGSQTNQGVSIPNVSKLNNQEDLPPWLKEE